MVGDQHQGGVQIGAYHVAAGELGRHVPLEAGLPLAEARPQASAAEAAADRLCEGVFESYTGQRRELSDGGQIGWSGLPYPNARGAGPPLGELAFTQFRFGCCPAQALAFTHGRTILPA
ncbi:hypothetical protein [Nonomuraea africana]|uniref:Uncharacterized protein n=1 Tax=Nonomuraea africana TaxID=46171 RepID=A0ABR9KCT3_9ACTN|nr:hypothetical protein [Nonomuraea africana]MBE1559819.1 hypothetical protein [Nonomuraea africana]